MNEQPVNPNIPAPTKNFTRKVFWYWSIVVIAAATAAALVLVNTIKPQRDESFSVTVGKPKPKTPPSIPNLTPVKGQLAQGFPTDFILDPKAKIEYSGNVASPFQTGHNLLSASYLSSQSMDTLQKAYEQFFQANNWQVMSQNSLPGQVYFGAANLTTLQSVNLNIVPKPDNLNEVQITITKPQ